MLKEVVTIRNKGNSKRVAKPNFWGVYEKKVPTELKDWGYSKYNSMSLFVYCDASASKDTREMAVGCAQVQNNSVIVKQKFVYPPAEAFYKNVYGELKAVIFGLEIFPKYMEQGSTCFFLYTDVKDISKFLSDEIIFRKNEALRDVQLEMNQLYKQVKKQHPELDIAIRYLPPDKKAYNPFAKASHNSAKRMLNSLR